MYRKHTGKQFGIGFCLKCGETTVVYFVWMFERTGEPFE